ncbi:hypothetical protein ITJ66_16810 [Plantibacter sp. VKM Ac-2885]|nr:hypothetical protein [Plantibacter sp. VKM Ac-2885]MBF4514149.1 hypothetical protein [Plantibacter sp. VKM Ac-2885]
MALDYDAIVKYISAQGGVSIVEIARMLDEQGIPSKGDLRLHWPYEPVVIWDGASEGLLDVLRQLIADERIELNNTQPLVYIIDGAALTLPMADIKSVERKHPYKTARWLPVVFNKR